MPLSAVSFVAGAVVLGKMNFGLYVDGLGAQGAPLMTSINCLLYFHGFTCLLIILALMTLPGIPMQDSPDGVSFPSHIPL